MQDQEMGQQFNTHLSSFTPIQQYVHVNTHFLLLLGDCSNDSSSIMTDQTTRVLALIAAKITYLRMMKPPVVSHWVTARLSLRTSPLVPSVMAWYRSATCSTGQAS